MGTDVLVSLSRNKAVIQQALVENGQTQAAESFDELVQEAEAVAGAKVSKQPQQQPIRDLVEGSDGSKNTAVESKTPETTPEINELSKNGKIYGNFLRGSYLEIISSTNLYGGNLIKLKPNGTTTVTGVLDDVNSVAFRGQITPGVTKMGANPGGINVLRSPQWSQILQKYISILNAGDDISYWKKVADEFWKEVNKPWLDEAITRGNNFRFVSNPSDELAIFVTRNKKLVLNSDGHKIQSTFGREVDYLKSKGHTLLSDGTAVK